MTQPVFILGGAQTDFAKHWSRNGLGIVDMIGEATRAALVDCGLVAKDIDAAHVGNFCGELFTGQGQLGGALTVADPGFHGVPAARHEAACASGGVALLAATAEIEAERYGCVLIVGAEMERNVSGVECARLLGSAAWVGHEATEARYVWPHVFSELAGEYDRRYGLRYEHLAAIARTNLENARQNPLAQTRGWAYSEASFSTDDSANPVVEGVLRRQDCGQVTDGAAAVILASATFAEEWARKRGVSLTSLPRVLGWGHRTTHLGYKEKLLRSANTPLVFPHVKQAIDDALRRAKVTDVWCLDGVETHDCFSMSEYMAIDHFGMTAPGESWKAIEAGVITKKGRLPVNPSGGLIGVGHPVGATGVRMVHDAAQQVRGRAGGTQIDGARRFGTLNIGGSTTTTVSFVIGV